MAKESDGFDTFMSKERERISKEREGLLSQQQEIGEKLTALDRQLAAMQAYQDALEGKAPTAPAPKARTPRTSSGPRAPRGEVSGKVLEIIKQAGPDGIKRGDILSKCGIVEKENKKGAQSVSNALANMQKGDTPRISRSEDGHYRAA